jgi:hypothetical protein
MFSIKTRNAFYRGWFAARAHREPPPPVSREEEVYMDLGFSEGRKSEGKPLKALSPRPAYTPLPLNIDMELTRELPPLPRPREEAPPEARRAVRPSVATTPKSANTDPEGWPLQSLTEGEAKDTPDAAPETPRLPERSPQYNLPRKNPWGGAPSTAKRARYNR